MLYLEKLIGGDQCDRIGVALGQYSYTRVSTLVETIEQQDQHWITLLGVQYINQEVMTHVKTIENLHHHYINKIEYFDNLSERIKTLKADNIDLMLLIGIDHIDDLLYKIEHYTHTIKVLCQYLSATMKHKNNKTLGFK